MGSITLPLDIETFVLESDGKGLCFIADGLDEYPAGYKDKTNLIFSELIGTQKPNIKLPQSTVVISSRPGVTSRVWHSFDKHVEVLGFGDDQINEYIQEKYGEDKSFSSYLDGHPHIKHTLYSSPPIIGVGSNSILRGPNVIYTAIAAICDRCMNINKVSRVKYWSPAPLPPGSYAYAYITMLVYLKDYLLDDTNLPKTETDFYEQFIDFCSKDPTSSCSQNNTLPTSLSNIDESSEIGILLFHIAKLAYSGIYERQSIFTEVEPVLQHTNSSLLVVDKMSVLQPTTYSFPHLTIQEFLAAFYFNT